MQAIHRNVEDRRFVPWLLAVAISVVSGIAGKFRNLVIVTPFQAVWLSTKADAMGSKVFAVGVGLVLVSNVWGVVNVVRHSGTTKNSWNLPIEGIVGAARTARAQCGPGLVVATFEPVTTDRRALEGFRLIGPFSAAPSPTSDRADCLMTVITFAGSVSDAGRNTRPRSS